MKNIIKTIWKLKFLPLLLLFMVLCSGCASSGYDLGFLSVKDEAIDGSDRFRVAGPLFETQIADRDKSFLAGRPFYNRVSDPASECTRHEFLWPLGMVKSNNGELYWRFLNMVGQDFDAKSDADPRYKFMFFPFIFTGQTRAREKYFAFFPFGGVLKDFLLKDRIEFILFPLYSRAVVKNIEKYDFLWPLISWTKKDGKVVKHRALPFYAFAEREGAFKKMSVMWPIWSSVEYMYPGSSGKGFILFPFFGRVKLTNQSTWWLFPPLFKWSKSKDDTKLYCPWPFFQYSSGEIDKLYVWPLWGKKKQGGASKSFFLWPIFRFQQVKGAKDILKRFMMVPFVQYETRRRKGDAGQAQVEMRDASLKEEGGEVVGRFFKLWPLLSYRREHDEVLFKMLDLWPTKRLVPVERNFAPFWTLYSHVRRGEEREDELLWGLFRYRRGGANGSYMSVFPLISTKKASDGKSREWKVLYGLVGYKRENLRKTYRLLYFIKWHKEEEE